MIIHKANDGSVAVTMFANDITEEQKVEAIARFKEQHPGIYLESYEGEYKLPSGQFRNAWTLKDNAVIIDSEKAKEIHLNRIREARNKKLDEMDKEHLRHINTPGMSIDIDKKKQVLRDVPQNYVWDLNNVYWPEELGEVK